MSEKLLSEIRADIKQLLKESALLNQLITIHHKDIAEIKQHIEPLKDDVLFAKRLAKLATSSGIIALIAGAVKLYLK